ncbi:MAG: PIN domain-containing protein [Candidatus Helarchaeota archaeon]|nr:PIN domain-containing protein [Candidatus Helarchaeota archaeon]
MKRKLKVYLDTSVISALHDKRNPERKALTEEFFKKMENFEVYISDITVVEIEKTPDSEIQNEMKKIITNFSVCSLPEDLEWLINEYMRYGAFSESYKEDAYHIAVAVLNELDYLLSWNFKHIVRKKTKDIVRMVNTLNNLHQIEIMTPAELL